MYLIFSLLNVLKCLLLFPPKIIRLENKVLKVQKTALSKLSRLQLIQVLTIQKENKTKGGSSSGNLTNTSSKHQ